jgi:hypothetical protein
MNGAKRTMTIKSPRFDVEQMADDVITYVDILPKDRREQYIREFFDSLNNQSLDVDTLRRLILTLLDPKLLLWLSAFFAENRQLEERQAVLGAIRGVCKAFNSFADDMQRHVGFDA